MKLKTQTGRAANVLSDPQVGPRADWGRIFGNDRPVQIEIGTGKGTALLELAKLFPDHNFLGIEWARQYCLYAARRLAHWGRPNVRMLRTDGREFLIDRVPTAGVLAVHVYFPDPWPKSGQHKRRLFIGEFRDAVVRVLAQGGRLRVATDHEEYFRHIERLVAAAEGLRPCPTDELFGRSLAQLETNYEAKFAKAGRTIYRLAAERV